MDDCAGMSRCNAITFICRRPGYRALGGCCVRVRVRVRVKDHREGTMPGDAFAKVCPQQQRATRSGAAVPSAHALVSTVWNGGAWDVHFVMLSLVAARIARTGEFLCGRVVNGTGS